MRGTTGMLVVGALAAGACGGGGAIKQASPALPVNLTVYVNDSRVSLSPDSVGAGPVVFIVTNQASRTKSLSLLPAGTSAAQPVASTGTISPKGTAQVTVDLSAGDYSLTTAVNDGTGTPPSTTGVQAATLHIGPPRPSGANDLLQP
ncbi:MAG TPA: hypothetical protein VIX82_17390 [Solirubrobacteraceae bacterium]